MTYLEQVLINARFLAEAGALVTLVFYFALGIAYALGGGYLYADQERVFRRKVRNTFLSKTAITCVSILVLLLLLLPKV